MTDKVLLAARDLTHSYGRHTALGGVDVELKRGQILGFLGLNGAGKSTTLEILSGAIRPQRGHIEIGGYNLATHSSAAKRLLGYLPQRVPLYDDMRVDEYLQFCATIRGVEPGARDAAVALARERTGLSDQGARIIRHLSGGYRQRLGIAQAIVHQPQVLILDEPTAGLDPAQIRDVYRLLHDLAGERAVLISTHILSEVQALASRVMILHHGKIVYDGLVDTADGNYRMRFARQPTVAALGAVRGVQAVSQQADGGWLVETTADSPQALLDAAAAADWQVLELVPNYDGLERLFMRLTSGDREAQANR